MTLVSDIVFLVIIIAFVWFVYSRINKKHPEVTEPFRGLLTNKPQVPNAEEIRRQIWMENRRII